MQNKYNTIGLMSGTSLDGLDIAHCFFVLREGEWLFTLDNSTSIEYPQELRDRLKNSVNLSSVDLLLLNNEFGKWLGDQVKQFVSDKNIKIDFVASHGHTVFHQPDKGLTYQIGAGQQLANRCGVKVISDFRSLDLSLGGQGAPLVPIGDQMLFSEFDFCLNLGGIANVSFEIRDERVAYDLCPANMLLNHLTTQIGKAYDDNGEIARSGNINESLLDSLNSLNYYEQPFPKSLGYEWFCEEVIPIIDKSTCSIPDKLCTSVHHIAFQIFNELSRFQISANATLLATGGGARNTFLIETLTQYINKAAIKIIIPESQIVDFKEAIVFAFMGVKRLRGEINCLRSVTGATANSSSGVIYYPY